MRRAWLVALLLAAPAARAEDAGQGQRLFQQQCRACHVIEAGGRQAMGPNLHGVVGRRAAAVEGYRYSAPLRARGEAGEVWSVAALDAYLENPRAVVPGGAMTYVGLRDAAQRQALIAWMATQRD